MENQNLNINIDPSIKPIFADEVVVARMVKQENRKSGKIVKEGNLSLIFLDALGNKAVARITLSKTTAKSLAQVLKINVKDLEKELRNKKNLKHIPSSKESITNENYIGWGFKNEKNCYKNNWRRYFRRK